MAQVIDATKVIELLEAVVKDIGEGHTAECLYRGFSTETGESNDEPGCIAGQVVYKLGGLDALKSLSEGGIISNYENRPVLVGLGFDEDAIRVLSLAQRVQDIGEEGTRTWGQALKYAKREAGELANV